MRTTSLLIFAFLLPTTLRAAEPDRAKSVLIEAERFDNLGGWVNDSQWMDEMGSPYLLAHGLGNPVADATAAVKFPAAGTYRVLVRTKDWVAQWKAPGAPGKFQLLINGNPLSTTFGTQGAQWHWQDGGTVQIASTDVKLALHDLTGYEGRCDAILFTSQTDLTPPNADPEMAGFRRKLLGLPDQPEDAGSYDLVVVGGGIAGTCAAISGSRMGLKVALIQDRPVLGGNNSSEVRVWLQGAKNLKPFPRIGDVVAELEQKKTAHYGPTNTAEIYEDEKKLDVVRAEKNLALFVNHRMNGIEMDSKTIKAVIAQDVVSGKRLRFAAKLFADCTGDGCVGFLAKADWEMTVPGRMGACNLWNVIDTKTPQTFAKCPWALDLSDKPFPGRSKEKPDILKLGGWYWESGFNLDPFTKGEYTRDWNFRAMYGAWDAMKNVDYVLPNHKLNWCAYVSGKRESRRILGDVILSKEDLLNGKEYDDGFVPTGWKMDLHHPDKKYDNGFEGDAFISYATFGKYKEPYWIPYRSLYSRNITNLFAAGRCMSVTHDALGASRVMRTGGLMGEVVGLAASICNKHSCTPREVYTKHLPEMIELVKTGAGKKIP